MTFNPFKRKIRHISGVRPDERLQEEKKSDFRTEEIIVSAAPLNWKLYEDWKRDPENIKMLNDTEVNLQNNVGSCASQGGSLLLADNNYVEDGRFIKMSAKPIYARRRNKPSAGMYMDDLAKIMTTYGTVPELLYPSPNDTDENMSNLDDYISAFESIGKIFRAKNHFWLYETKNIDSFATILAMNKPIIYTVLFGDNGWNKKVPETLSEALMYGHLNMLMRNGFFIYNGKKALYSQDSWGKNANTIDGRRIITEDWFINNRIVCGVWFEDMNNLAVFNPDVVRPKYNFTNDLYFGMRNDEVKVLQKCLATEKDSNGYLFPVYQTFTNYFGSITLQAVKRFQKKYNIEPVLGYCGPKTRAQLNKIFI